ncbi:YunG family protein [Bacillus infantis]|uniref:YunG family protein n=1 Tax=Bacillus infantis TaxID=324767 RepID=UPI003CF65D4E
MRESTIVTLQKALLVSWSIHSSSKWTKEKPAKGQCGVTALVVNDILGGTIRKTPLLDGWHFYNEINGIRYDFTVSQFNEEIRYLDIFSNREEAFLDTNHKQYDYLKQSVLL